MNYSKEEKAMWLEDWKGSGKKAWTYAKENGLIPQTFCSWAKREAADAAGKEDAVVLGLRGGATFLRRRARS